MTDNVDRLHRALVDAMRRTRGDDFDTPITVSQIYQELVPYRVARSSIGFDMNADYEFALLRLLGGERGLARLEPSEVRAILSKEAESPNPNVSLFRAYANCDVWIAPPQDWITEMVAEPEAESDIEIELEDTPGVEAPEEWEPPAEWEGPPAIARPAQTAPAPRFIPAAEEPPVVEQEAAPETPDKTPQPHALPMTGTRPSQCAFCGGNLPSTRLVNFCPHCGNDLTQQPCSNCGEILEASWKFCIACGASAGGYDTQAN
jgi:hypothetical protein